jgi:hypothetical protein
MISTSTSLTLKVEVGGQKIISKQFTSRTLVEFSKSALKKSQGIDMSSNLL